MLHSTEASFHSIISYLIVVAIMITINNLKWKALQSRKSKQGQGTKTELLSIVPIISDIYLHYCFNHFTLWEKLYPVCS